VIAYAVLDAEEEAELLADERDDPLDSLIAASERDMLHQLLLALPTFERDVVTRRWGVYGPEESFQAIADTWHRHRATVLRAEQRALMRLQELWLESESGGRA
jgi:DNA-directed RNA polymerase sigma subunit (sigma70/sigma32)